jgi:nucleolar complex protein 3
LLSPQFPGEALNIDLNDFINHLYSIIPSLSASPEVDRSPIEHRSDVTTAFQLQSPSDLLFKILHHVFSPRISASVSPAWRSAAFAKRLLTAALHWPPRSAIRAIEFVARLVVKESRLQGLLSTEDQSADGVYRPDVDDPQLSQPFGTSFWELRLLEKTHYDNEVREAARKLSLFTPT